MEENFSISVLPEMEGQPPDLKKIMRAPDTLSIFVLFQTLSLRLLFRGLTNLHLDSV